MKSMTYNWQDGKSLTIGEKTLVMGILNVTPDSFSDGGLWNDKDKALAHMHEMVRDGADIIDIGAESSRPGFEPMGAAEEIARLDERQCALPRRCARDSAERVLKRRAAACCRDNAHIPGRSARLSEYASVKRAGGIVPRAKWLGAGD